METDSKLNKKAIKAGTWYSISNILLKGCLFFTLPVFTRILSTSDFGVYNTYMAYEGIISAILGLGLYGTVKNAKMDFKDNFDDYLSSIIIFSIVLLFTFVIGSNVLYVYYSNIFGFSRVITNCLILQSFATFLIYFYGAKLNIEFKYKSYLVISFANTILNILMSILFIKLVFPNERYLGRIIGSALPEIIIAIVLVILILKRGNKKIDKLYLKYALRIGLPLVPHVISQSLLSQFDRIMISSMTNVANSGLYSYIYTICTITYVICMSLDNAWTPWVYHKFRENCFGEIKKASKEYIQLFLLLSIGFMCIMPEITKIIADESYWNGIDLIIPLTISNYFIFLYMIPVGIEYYNKKTSFISIGTVTAALINLFSNYIVIKVFGYKGAAYTTMISYIFLFILHWTISKKYGIEKLYDKKDFVVSSFLIIFIGGLFLFMNYYINSLIYLILRYLIILIIVYLLIKKVRNYLGVKI